MGTSAHRESLLPSCELCGKRVHLRDLSRWERIVNPEPVRPLSSPMETTARRETVDACAPCGRAWYRREEGAGDSPMGTEPLPESPCPDPDRPADTCRSDRYAAYETMSEYPLISGGPYADDASADHCAHRQVSRGRCLGCGEFGHLAPGNEE
jgi:hypothetical protein